jgi:hypothetical protein
VNRALKPCGTPAAYRRHLRWGQDPCESCKEAEYLRVRKGRPRQPLRPCGTRAGYERHRKAGEEPCADCRHANNTEAAEARQKRATRTSEIPHGINGYDNWDCRCQTCRRAKSEANREQRVRREKRKAATA